MTCIPLIVIIIFSISDWLNVSSFTTRLSQFVTTSLDWSQFATTSGVSSVFFFFFAIPAFLFRFQCCDLVSAMIIVSMGEREQHRGIRAAKLHLFFIIMYANLKNVTCLIAYFSFYNTLLSFCLSSRQSQVPLSFYLHIARRFSKLFSSLIRTSRGLLP